MQNDKEKLIKSSVARLKPYQTHELISKTLVEGASFGDSDDSSLSQPPMAAHTPGVLFDEKDLGKQKRAKKRTTRLKGRKFAQKCGKAPIVEETFFGDQTLGVRG